MWSLALVLFVTLIPHATALWPKPKVLNTGTEFLKLSPSFTVHYLSTDKLERLVPGRGSDDASSVEKAPFLDKLTISLEGGGDWRSIAEESIKPLGQRNEHYSLRITEDGKVAEITAETSLGVLRGLTTFEQLWHYLDGVTYLHEAPLFIDDEPSYVWRGLMLDTTRNFFPVNDIKRTFDTMSMVKMNTFHWHVVDSQSFPLEVPEYPELSAKGAYSKSEVYSTRDVEDLTAYAAKRGIDVVVEVDTPGHTAAISEAYPEHIACPYASPWGDFAAEPPAGQLRLASSATTEFTKNLLSAIAIRLPSTIFSTGGDEMNEHCYEVDGPTQKDLMSKGWILEDALKAFTSAIHNGLKAIGETAVVWEDMLLEHSLSLLEDTIVMVWKSSENAAKVAGAGHRLVHAPSDYFYLDCGAGEWLGNAADSTSWCDPFKSWQKAYTFDPIASIPSSQQHLVLGGQQLLWAEQSGPENMDSIIWPRAAASGEVFWTGQYRDSVQDALPRLHDLRFRMVKRGVKAIPLQPYWCALRPGACDAREDANDDINGKNGESEQWRVRLEL
ncbi:beta-hexosaminidase [Flagelloscypha sp. PMI_526]|nr:beta-hexosaminidase [Flagelloscypha sp. PMI_526]